MYIIYKILTSQLLFIMVTFRKINEIKIKIYMVKNMWIINLEYVNNSFWVFVELKYFFWHILHLNYNYYVK